MVRAPAAFGGAYGRTAPDPEINILSVLRLLRRRALAITLITTAGTAMFAAATMTMTPLYSATAVLRIDPSARSPVAETSSDSVLRSSQAVNAMVESDVEMLESPGLMRRIVEKLNLDADPEFIEAESPIDTARDWVRDLLNPPDPNKTRNLEAAAAGTLARNVEARRIGRTYLVEVEAWSLDPAKAARIANTAVEESLASQIDAKRGNVARVNTLLSEHISELRERLQASEEAVQRYMSTQGAGQDVQAAQGARRVTPPGSTSTELLNADVLTKLREQNAEASQRFAEVSARYGPNHPMTVRAKAELEKISGQIARLSEKTVRLNELQREADANRDLYQAVLQRAKQTAAAQELQMPGAYLVTKAAVPNAPSAPKRMVIVVIGLLASLGLAIAYAIAREVMASGIRDAEDLRQSFGLSPIASVPRVGTGRRRAIETMHGRFVHRSDLWSEVLDHPDSPFSESIRSLRFSLNRYAELGEEMRVLMISSVQQGEGKTTVAANLAREAAAAGERVLLIDADLRRPDLAAAFGITGDGGLVSLLSGPDDQRYRIQREPRSGVHVIAGGQGVPGALALRLLSSQAMDRLLRIARNNFDLVVIDTAPLMPITDPRALIERVDGVVMVVSDKTSHEMIAAALHETPGLNERLVGIALNRIPNGIGHRYHHYTAVDNPAQEPS